MSDHASALEAAMKAGRFDPLNHVARKSVEDAVAAYLSERGGDAAGGAVNALIIGSYVNESAHNVLVKHTGMEGGCPRIDWYKLRNEIAEAIEAGIDDFRSLSAIAVPPAESNAEIERLREIERAAKAYVDSVNGDPEKDCWDTEDGKEAPGAERFASDWSWQEYDAKKQQAFDTLRAALESKGGLDAES